MIVKTITITCPYCGKEAPWMSNDEIYGKRYGKSYMCYYCKDCDAYVGCHNNTTEQLGIMANKELRDWRKKAHASFDPMWKEKKMFKDRKKAYIFLHGKMNLSVDKCHIAMFDVDKCKQVISIFSL